MKLLSTLILLSSLILSAPGAGAATLGGGPTDESVCDLGNDALSQIDYHVKHVPSTAPRLVEIYTRLTLRYVGGNCRDGQLLLLRSSTGSALDQHFLRDASGQLCRIADVARQGTGTSEHPQAFELRCTISKIDAARGWLAAAEATEATEALIDAGYPAPRPRCKLLAGIWWLDDGKCDKR